MTRLTHIIARMRPGGEIEEVLQQWRAPEPESHNALREQAAAIIEELDRERRRGGIGSDIRAFALTAWG